LHHPVHWQVQWYRAAIEFGAGERVDVAGQRDTPSIVYCFHDARLHLAEKGCGIQRNKNRQEYQCEQALPQTTTVFAHTPSGVPEFKSNPEAKLGWRQLNIGRNYRLDGEVTLCITVRTQKTESQNRGLEHFPRDQLTVTGRDAWVAGLCNPRRGDGCRLRRGTGWIRGCVFEGHRSASESVHEPRRERGRS
jgi:hypothetical protein